MGGAATTDGARLPLTAAGGHARAMATDPTLAPMTPRRPPQPATVADWLAIPEEARAELIDGSLIFHAMPGPQHGIAQTGVSAVVRANYHRRRSEPDGLGGWWISQEVDMVLGSVACRPDVLGWERARHPRLPRPDGRGVVTDVPQWICEVLSPSTAAVDLGRKRSAYHRAGVDWYWLADPANRTLTVLRRAESDYLVVLAGGVGEVLRAEPFAGVDLDVSTLFDFDDDEAPAQ